MGIPVKFREKMNALETVLLDYAEAYMAGDDKAARAADRRRKVLRTEINKIYEAGTRVPKHALETLDRRIKSLDANIYAIAKDRDKFRALFLEKERELKDIKYNPFNPHNTEMYWDGYSWAYRDKEKK